MAFGRDEQRLTSAFAISLDARYLPSTSIDLLDGEEYLIFENQILVDLISDLTGQL